MRDVLESRFFYRGEWRTFLEVVGDGFVVGTTKPTAQNTGPAALYSTPTTVINGDITLATNQVLENALVYGCVTMGSNSKLRKSNVYGRGDSSTYPGRNSMILIPAGLGIAPTVEYNKIRPQVPLHYSMNNIVSNGPVILYRNDISGGTDFMKATGSQGAGAIEGNYFHGYSFHNDDNDQAGSTPAYVSHNDGVQFNSGIIGFNYRGNNVEMYYDPDLSVGAPPSGIASGNEVGLGVPLTVSGSNLTRDLDIWRNWFSGGGSAGLLQANSAPPASQEGIPMGRIAENRVAFDQYPFGGTSRYQIRYHVDYTSFIDETTNYFDPSLPGVVAAGISNKLFSVGTSSTSGIRRG